MNLRKGMSMDDLISIVLPIYNGEKYMKQSIDSVINQTYANWELLIVDDGSTDNTAAIAREYAEKDNRIKYYKNPQNMRLPKTLNRGFSLATGDYLTWTSDDNYYYPTALEKMYTTLVRQNAEFVFASCDVIDDLGRVVECIMVSDRARKLIVGSNPVGACFLYSRKVYEVVGEYDPEMTLVEDIDYWQRICIQFEPVCLGEKLYAYRWHDSALTSTMRKDMFNKTLEKMLLKNRPGFGNLDWESQYYYYRGLYNCRKNSGDKEDPYIAKYFLYKTIYFVRYRVSNKIRRTLQSLQ